MPAQRHLQPKQMELDLGVQTRAWPETKEPRQAKLEAKGRELVSELPAHNQMRRDVGYSTLPSSPAITREAKKAYSKAQTDLQTRSPAILTPEDKLPAILESGRFKNQHETGTSGGMNDPHYRREFEERHFNYPGGVPNDALPIYGYMASTRASSVAHEDETRRQYGNAEVHLKDSVKDRMSVTHADSLGGHYDAVPLDDAVSGKADPVGYTRGHIDTNYTEAQFHGGVRTSDISHVDLHDLGRGWASDGTDDSPGSPRHALQQAGIPYRSMMYGRTHTQGSFLSRNSDSIVLGGTPTGDRGADEYVDEYVDEERFGRFSQAQTRTELWASEQWAPGMSKPMHRDMITNPKVDTFISKAREAHPRPSK